MAAHVLLFSCRLREAGREEDAGWKVGVVAVLMHYLQSVSGVFQFKDGVDEEIPAISLDSVHVDVPGYGVYGDGIVGHGHFGIEFLDIAQHRGCARFKVVTVDLTAQSAVVQLILISCDGASGTCASIKINLGHNVCLDAFTGLAVHLGNLRGASLHAYPKVAVVGLGYSRNLLSHVNGLANGGLSLFQYEQLAACDSKHLSIGYGHGQLACPFGAFDEGFDTCLAVKEVHAVVIADKDVFLIKHGV